MNMAQWSDLPLVLTSEQTAAVLQLKRRTIANMLDRGDLRGVKVGKEWRVGRAELLRFVESNGKSKIMTETADDIPAIASPAIEDADWEAFDRLTESCAVRTGITDLAHQHDHYLYGKPRTE